MKGWLPYALGAVLVVQLAGLGAWQISRAQDKRAVQDAFDRQTRFTRFVHGMDVEPFQRLSAEGEFDAAHQFLLDNIIVDSRYGHYVLTPVVVGLLLWLLLDLWRRARSGTPLEEEPREVPAPAAER